MKALLLKNRQLSPAEISPPDREPGEALIRITHFGICNTDLELVKGYMGFNGVPGHEFVGRVVESDSAELVGKRVVGEINIGCNACDWCSQGMQRHCQNRTVLGILNKNGVMAEYVTLPDQNLFEVPPEISDEQAVFTEPLAAAFEIIAQCEISKSDRILVLGDGKLAQLIARTLVLYSDHVLVAGKYQAKLELLKARQIKTIDVNQIGSQTFDIVVDATGSAQGFNIAVAATRPRGTLVLKSTVAETHDLNLAALVINEITVIGSRCGLFEPALDALKTQKISVDDLITSIVPFSDVLYAFQLAEQKESLKIIVSM